MRIKICPLKLDMQDLLGDQDAYASQVSKRICQIDQETDIAREFESGDQSFKKYAVERDVGHIKTEPHKGNPPNGRQLVLDKQITAAAADDKSQEDKPMRINEGLKIIPDHHHAAND